MAVEQRPSSPRLHATPITDLRELVARPGPFASVYLPLELDQVDAPDRLQTRWRQAEDELSRAGAPADLVKRMRAAVPATSDLTGGGLAVIADAVAEPLVEDLGVRVTEPFARWAPLAVLAPLIGARQSQVVHLVVAIDRAGADIFAVDGNRTPDHEEVQGDSWPIEKNAPGGLSQPRYHRRAETSWEENAGQVAEAVVEMARRVDAQFVAVAGDQRSVALLRHALPPEIEALVHEIRGSRQADGSADASAEDLVRLVASARAEVTAGMLRQIREQTSTDGRAAVGPEAVVEALAMGRVETLLVKDDPDDTRTAWYGAEPMHVALTRADVEAMGDAEPAEARLLDVAVWAAIGSGAGVHLIPATTYDGLAALLRWA